MSVVRAALLLAAACAAARGEEASPAYLAEPAAQGYGSASAGTACCTSVPNNFWIVSSRRCRQSCEKCCPLGDLDYFHVDERCQLHLWNRAALHQWLQPGAPICIVVHGSFVESNDLLDGDPPMFQWIRGAAPELPLNVIFYSWPSDAPITMVPHADIAILGRRASFNALYLADLISQLPPGHPVCLVGHSHGARMVAATLHLLAGGEVQGHCLWYTPANNPRIRTVLLAAALDHHWLVPGQRFGRALYRSEAVINVRNDHDIVLNAYPFRRLFSHRALGESGVTRRDRFALGEVNGRLTEMDVTHLIGTGHLWYNYHRRPEIACALRPYFYFDDVQQPAAATAPPPSRAAAVPPMPAPPAESPEEAAVTPAPRRSPVRHGSSERDTNALSDRRS